MTKPALFDVDDATPAPAPRPKAKRDREPPDLSGLTAEGRALVEEWGLDAAEVAAWGADRCAAVLAGRVNRLRAPEEGRPLTAREVDERERAGRHVAAALSGGDSEALMLALYDCLFCATAGELREFARHFADAMTRCE